LFLFHEFEERILPAGRDVNDVLIARGSVSKTRRFTARNETFQRAILQNLTLRFPLLDYNYGVLIAKI
jgi:hypothetical protein